MKCQCLLIAVLSVMWIDAGAASETTLRCRGRLVSIGDTRTEVREICGEPDRLSHWEEGHNTTVARIFDYETERYQAPEKIETPIQMERWTYDFGSTRFVRDLYFENGKLIRMETGDKGSN